MTSWTRELRLPLEEGKRKRWKPYSIFRGASAAMAHLTCHVSVLSGGYSPHEPHAHPEEELLLVLDGNPQLVLATPSGSTECYTTSPGHLAYYPGGQLHTITNRSEHPATYLMFKWRNDDTAAEAPRLAAGIHHCWNAIPDAPRSGEKSWKTRRIFQGSTQWLARLQCHVTTLAPGGGYEPHADPYDVALIVRSGTVETLGARLQPSDVAFFHVGELHGMRNATDAAASYLVFEFQKSTDH